MNEAVLEEYMHLRSQVYEELIQDNVDNAIISETNWIARGHYPSGEEVGIHVRVGDVVYMDFGQAYLNEMGYQHFALVIALCEKKALVVPMTSNIKTCENAYDSEHLKGKKNLYCYPGIIEGLNKKSVLFLNDMKFINTARIIDVKGHINVKSNDFIKIKARILRMVSSGNAM